MTCVGYVYVARKKNICHPGALTAERAEGPQWQHDPKKIERDLNFKPLETFGRWCSGLEVWSGVPASKWAGGPGPATG